MHLDPLLPRLFALATAVILVGLVLHRIKQPLLVGYILVGVLLGPSVTGFVERSEHIAHVGNLGVVLLLFYLGMEISIPRLLNSWKIAIIGTALQVTVSVLVVAGIGTFFAWSPGKILLFGFMLALSSTAVILRVLKDTGESESKVGTNVTGVLLVQDLMLAPMLIALGFFSGETHFNPGYFAIQGLGLGAILALLAWISRHGHIELPFSDQLKENPEMQFFTAMALCFGPALLTGILGLSTALGAFIGGILISRLRGTHWVRGSLETFQVFFLGLFFVSIGLLVDVVYIWENLGKISLLLTVVLLVNTAINTLLFRALGEKWRESLYSGAMLSQIGEFSFILAAVGLQAKIISDQMGYQTALSVISLSLLISPAWIALFRKFIVGGRKGISHPVLS